MVVFLCGALIWIDKHVRPRGTELFAMYVAGYTFMRFWIERLRVDPASKLWGWRVNESRLARRVRARRGLPRRVDAPAARLAGLG